MHPAAHAEAWLPLSLRVMPLLSSRRVQKLFHDLPDALFSPADTSQHPNVLQFLHISLHGSLRNAK